MQRIARSISILALTAVGVATATAQDYAYGSGHGIAYASFSSASGYGLYMTGGGPYSGETGSRYGQTFIDDSFGGGPGDPIASDAQGIGVSIAQPYGYESIQFGGGSFVTIHNISGSYQTLDVYVSTYGFGSTYATSWNETAVAYGQGVVTDSLGVIDQNTYVEAYSLGRGLGGNGWSVENYDTINGSTMLQGFDGNSFPGGSTVAWTDVQNYAILLAPGASDSLEVNANEGHTTFAITPGPAAFAPYAVGLAGILRRRRGRQAGEPTP